MGGRGHSAHGAHYIEAFNGMGRWFPNPPHTNPGHFPTLLDPTDRKMPRFLVRGVGVLAVSKPPVLPGGLEAPGFSDPPVCFAVQDNPGLGVALRFLGLPCAHRGV